MWPNEVHVAPGLVALPRVPVARLRLASDERLANLVGGGSEAAFAVLFQRFNQPLYRYCRSLLGNDADAQDALQITFTQALVALREDRRTAPVRPWLYRIAHNEAISLLRRRRPAVELPEEGGVAAALEEVVDQRARLHTLVADLQELPARQRGALVMRELSGLSHAEIAQALDISVEASKQTVLEARRSLLEFAQGRSMACEEIQRAISDGDRRTLRGRRVRAHLRGCSTCRAFAEVIPVRQAELHALSPALPGAMAAGVLGRVIGTRSGGGGGAGMAVGATGKALGLAASAKVAATSAAVVAVAAIGVGEINHFATRSSAAISTQARAARRPAPGGRSDDHLRYPVTLTSLHQASAATASAATASAATAPAAEHRTAGRRVRARRRTGHAPVTGVCRAAVIASPRSSLHGRNCTQTTGSRSVHRTTAATATPGVTTGSRGTSTTAPGHTAQAQRATVQPHSTSPVTASTHGHSSHTGSGSAARGNSFAPSSATQPATGSPGRGQTKAGKAAK